MPKPPPGPAADDLRPWLIWLALAVDPLTAAIVLATQPPAHTFELTTD
jgi:hypothetical protein